MGYENAASTIALATHCARCGHPLRDAESVEVGMGPTCRKKVAEYMGSILTEDHRKLANELIHRIACDQGHTQVTKDSLTQLTSIGAVKAAQYLSKEYCAVSVVTGENELVVKSKYDAGFVREARKIGGRFDRDTKTWRFPLDQNMNLWTVIRRNYAGLTIFTEKLTREIPNTDKDVIIVQAQPSRQPQQQRKQVTCRECKAQNLSWGKNSADKWILLEQDGQPHVCSASKGEGPTGRDQCLDNPEVEITVGDVTTLVKQSMATVIRGWVKEFGEDEIAEMLKKNVRLKRDGQYWSKNHPGQKRGFKGSKVA